MDTSEDDFMSMAQFSGEPIEVSQMRRLTHNDPALKETMQDYKQLYGSTRMLYNSMVSRSQDKLSASLRRATVVPGRGLNRRPSLARVVFNKRRESAVLFLEKVKTNFFDDAKNLAAGTIPQSVVLALTIGTVCGIACWLYYSILFFLLEYIWKTLPEKIVVDNWEEENFWLWIPIVSFVMFVFTGLAVVLLGEPGDLPYTISRVHHDAYIPMNHVIPMAFASCFSILAGGSLGPEAPLVAICGALGGFVSRSIFRQKYVNIVRKHTLMGMAAALAAFFGAPLGGMSSK